MRRRFNVLEKFALRFAYAGRCAACDTALQRGWHADHKRPFALGGATTIDNGQPLCQQCNLKKGAQCMPEAMRPWFQGLRQWQKQCERKYIAALPQDFLIVATPGSGKTCMGVRIMHHHLASQSVDRIVVITPREHITTQWIKSAHEYGGIDLGRINNGDILQYGIANIANDYHGYAITYQQATSEYGRLAFQSFVHHFRQRVLVVLDELHHAGRDSDWGKHLQETFGSCVYRVALSGTPFRTDASPLPFVQYNAHGECEPDFPYGYKDALHDGTCRSVMFPKFEGELEWWNGEEILHKTFRDELSEQVARQRLKAAITSEWLDYIIRDAHNALMAHRRQGHTDAAGLIVCMDIQHAGKVGERVRQITGETPEVVTSDDRQSSERITAFATSARPWIVAVQMVSEGVDIPRLRVGVYATNILTELYFRQFVGRFVRTIDGLECDQTASIFIPSDDVLISHAKQVHDEHTHQARVDIQDILEELAHLDDGGVNDPPSLFDLDALRLRSVHAQGRAIPDGVIILYGEEFTAEEYAQAKAEVPQAAQSDQVLYGYMLGMRKVRSMGADTTPPHEPVEHGTPQVRLTLQEQKAQASQKEQSLIGILRGLYEQRHRAQVPEDFWKQLYINLNKLVGVKSTRFCSLEQYETRRQYLNQLIAQAEVSRARD